jgi:hypothetical protein
MRRPAVLAGVLMAVAVVALVLVSAFQRTTLAFTLGVAPAIPVLPLESGQRACQGDIEVPTSGNFDRVWLKVDRPGPDVKLEIVDVPTQTVAARGDLGASRDTVRVREIPAGAKVRVCVVNRGSRTIKVFGNPDVAAPPTTASLDGNPTGVDIALVFEREPRSLLSLAGAIMDRASLFKVGFFGGWTYWLLGLLVVAAVPALLIRALRGVEE